ncbi:hypothetical protein Tco_1364302 [Tanacetum coccineum]
MPRLPLDVCPQSFEAPRDRSYGILATKQSDRGEGDDKELKVMGEVGESYDVEEMVVRKEYYDFISKVQEFPYGVFVSSHEEFSWRRT